MSARRFSRTLSLLLLGASSTLAACDSEQPDDDITAELVDLDGVQILTLDEFLATEEGAAAAELGILAPDDNEVPVWTCYQIDDNGEELTYGQAFSWWKEAVVVASQTGRCVSTPRLLAMLFPVTWCDGSTTTAVIYQPSNPAGSMLDNLDGLHFIPCESVAP